MRRVELDELARAGGPRFASTRGAVCWRFQTLLGASLTSRSTSDDVTAFAELLSPMLARGTQRYLVILDLSSAPSLDTASARSLGRLGLSFRTASHRDDALAIVAKANDPHALALGHVALAMEPHRWSCHRTLVEALVSVGAADPANIVARLESATTGELAPDAFTPATRAYLASMPKASLTQCARALGTISRTLQRALVAEATSFASERTSVRMQLAASLLERKAWTVEAVAHEVGYASVPRFIAVFAEHFGATPGKWREARAR